MLLSLVHMTLQQLHNSRCMAALQLVNMLLQHPTTPRNTLQHCCAKFVSSKQSQAVAGAALGETACESLLRSVASTRTSCSRKQDSSVSIFPISESLRK